VAKRLVARKKFLDADTNLTLQTRAIADDQGAIAIFLKWQQLPRMVAAFEGNVDTDLTNQTGLVSFNQHVTRDYYVSWGNFHIDFNAICSGSDS